MSILPVTIPPKTLAQTISSSATTFKLNNIQGWGGVDLTPSDFGTEAYAVFINSTKTQIEIFKFDPATIADSEITILSRGLGYSGGDVEDAARKFPWTSNDTTVQIGTDAPQLFRDFVSESNPATITAQHTYDTLPESSVDPVNDDDFTRKAYVDGLTQPQISVEVNQTAHGLAVGNIIRVSGVNQFAKAQADSPANAEVVGIVTEVVDVDNFKYVTEGIITTGVPAFAAGTVLFLSRTVAGELTDTDTTTIGEVSLPLATINEASVRMTFHKFRGATINSISGNPVASETVAGSVEEATQAEADAETDVGGTGAKLFVPPSKIAAMIPNFAISPAWVPIGSFTPVANNTTLDILGIADYSKILIISNEVGSWNSGTPASAVRWFLVSDDNGSTWESTDKYLTQAGATTDQLVHLPQTQLGRGWIIIDNWNRTDLIKPVSHNGMGTVSYAVGVYHAAALNAIQAVCGSSRQFDGTGSYDVYGIPA